MSFFLATYQILATHNGSKTNETRHVLIEVLSTLSVGVRVRLYMTDTRSTSLSLSRPASRYTSLYPSNRGWTTFSTKFCHRTGRISVSERRRHRLPRPPGLVPVREASHRRRRPARRRQEQHDHGACRRVRRCHAGNTGE